jgi:hypothetical protein
MNLRSSNQRDDSELPMSYIIVSTQEIKFFALYSETEGLLDQVLKLGTK